MCTEINICVQKKAKRQPDSQLQASVKAALLKYSFPTAWPYQQGGEACQSRPPDPHLLISRWLSGNGGSIFDDDPIKVACGSKGY